MSNGIFSRHDPADYLKSEADIAAYLTASIEEGGDDPAFLARALGDVARARTPSHQCSSAEDHAEQMHTVGLSLLKISAQAYISAFGHDDGLKRLADDLMSCVAERQKLGGWMELVDHIQKAAG